MLEPLDPIGKAEDLQIAEPYFESQTSRKYFGNPGLDCQTAKASYQTLRQPE